MRHTVFLVCKVNQGVILVSYEFCEICKNTFLTEHLWATASFKIEMEFKIMTSTNLHVPFTNLHIWNNTTATTAENLEFYSKWAVSIYCPPMHIKIDCSFVKQVINGKCVRKERLYGGEWWAKWIILIYLIGSLFLQKKISCKQSRENVFFALHLSWLIIYPCKMN